MGKEFVLETTFLIDLERELGRSADGPALRFLEAHQQDSLFITFTIAGELAAGTSHSQRRRWEEFIAPYRVLASSADVSWEYGKAHRFLQENGLLIGTNDLWIAATALAHGMPVVTRNTRHFRRVPGLEVEEYES